MADVQLKLYDRKLGIVYNKGRFLGEGAFGKCYEFINSKSNEVYAAKVLPKSRMQRVKVKDTVIKEVEIHKELRHPNVVRIFGHFEDESNIYILLEMCKFKSMGVLLQRRTTVTEPETRYFMKDILNGIHYLHSKRVIHRDLKPDNLLLGDGLRVKIADFGISSKIQGDDLRNTVCGTPRFIAPEILGGNGYSFEADVWAAGCIMYILLIGAYPFTGSNSNELYKKIQRCDYKFNSTISIEAKKMIQTMLQHDPLRRPPAVKLLSVTFMVCDFCPKQLPTTSLIMAPKFAKAANNYLQVNKEVAALVSPQKGVPKTKSSFDSKQNLRSVMSLLHAVLTVKTGDDAKYDADESTYPVGQPIYWALKYVDYSNKCGFGYHLSDDSVGIVFNDKTKMLLLPNCQDVHYIEADGTESYFTTKGYPRQFDQKMRFLFQIHKYFNESTKIVGKPRDEPYEYSRIPHLHFWQRINSDMLLQLNNGTIQLSYEDGSILTVCPLMKCITHIPTLSKCSCSMTYSFSSMANEGCSRYLYEKMVYFYKCIKYCLSNNVATI